MKSLADLLQRLTDHKVQYTLDAMIQAKQALHRPRDREAVIQLKAIREKRQRN